LTIAARIGIMPESGHSARFSRAGAAVMWQRVSATYRQVLFVSLLGSASPAFAQPAITEVMHNPGGSDSLWEWVELRNISAGPLNLDGWVFDDDDDAHFAEANISAANGNTTIPAGGVAVLYAGDELEFMPQRFLNAWGTDTTLIPVAGFTTLTATDTIGLWPSHVDYMNDAIAMATSSPRRTFQSTAVSLDYDVTFPAASVGRSIAWNGVGSRSDGANWVESEEGVLGAVTSVETTIPSAQINSTLDLGNPGAEP
jgi:hypothetical protein